MIVVVDSITWKQAVELGHIDVEIKVLLEYLFELSSKSKTFCKWCTPGSLRQSTTFLFCHFQGDSYNFFNLRPQPPPPPPPPSPPHPRPHLSPAIIPTLNLSFFKCPSFYYRSCHGHLPLSPPFWTFVFFSSPWSRDISFFARVYYSCLFPQTVCTVLLSQCSLHEPVFVDFFTPFARVFLDSLRLVSCS